LKTTQRIIASLVIALAFATTALASPHGTLYQTLLGSLTLGDGAAVDELLRSARAALDAGNLELAESLIAKAESQNPTYGPFHMGDTPKKLRAELDKKRTVKPGAARAAGLGAARTAVKPNDGSTAQKDPFANRATAPATTPPALGLPTISPVSATEAAPPVERFKAPDPSAQISPIKAVAPWAAAQETPSGAAVNAAPPAEGRAEFTWTKNPAPATGNAKQQAGQQLLAARQALAQGDSRRATALLEQAKSAGVDFGPQDNEPVKVENLIRKHNELMLAREGREQTDAYRRQYSDLLLEEAQGLLKYNDLDGAERVTTDAQKLGVRYSPFETRPAKVLDLIAAARNGNKSPAAAPTNALPAANDVVATGPSTGNPRQSVQEALREARLALANGNVAQAELCVDQAEAWRLPESQYASNDDRPGLVRLEIQKAKQRTGAPVNNAVTPTAFGQTGAQSQYGTQALYEPANDKTRVETVQATAPGSIVKEPATLPAPPEPANKVAQGAGQRFYQQGEDALKAGDSTMALRYFQQAYQYRADLDPLAQAKLQDHLQLLSSPRNKKPEGDSLLPAAASGQQMVAKQIQAEIFKRTRECDKLMEAEPLKALESMKELRAKIEKTELADAEKNLLLRNVDTTLKKYSQYIEANKADIELAERNKTIRTEIDTNRKHRNEVDERIAKTIDAFNKAVHERNYIEAERQARIARELAPDNPVVVQIGEQSKLLIAVRRNEEIRDTKNQATLVAFQEVDRASTPFNKDFSFSDAKTWTELTRVRKGSGGDGNSGRSPKDIIIEQRLMTPISFSFRDKPLAEVLAYIGKAAQVNVHTDPQGLQAEGVTSDTTVTIDLQNEISAKSALNLILAPLHLSFVVKDEVLKITSERLRDNNVYSKTYNVADLVIPIPNFVPNGNMGLNGSIAEAYRRSGVTSVGGMMGFGGPTVVASNERNNGSTPKSVLANQNVLSQVRPGATGATAGGAGGGGPTTFGGHGGPGGLGGGTQADFDPLIELITSTVKPMTWEPAGGQGNVKGFESTLSLVVSNTQEVHDEIGELLKQLRRLQDLQVTIEVRFITLSDSFFERIGIDFDFNINDNSGLTPGFFPPDKNKPMKIIGTGPTDSLTPTPDLDIQFRQNSFGDANIPQFPGIAGTTPATLGFAILSDIEAYFLINAAQGDSRTNVLQAPKVTLFNGQQAFVSDTTQRPFVISVVPVVGDFAAAQQPVIVVLSEGTQMTVQAVVTADRRFVRLTVVPFFSQIGDVQEFTFTGSSTSKSTTSASNQNDATAVKSSTGTDATTTREGTTVQLPTFSFVTVTTTVSVPDGGTVLLGGIKRLSEGRNERGVPLLSKIPYVNRLFKNVGIARTTSSLMMMVTPHIIIQEEEEQKLLGEQPGG